MNENLPTTIDYKDPKVVATIKNTVAQGATDDEFLMFAEHCRSTGLNPFRKEVWFIKTKGYTNKAGQFVDGKVQIMTGLAGFLAIANRHPQFDGMECEVERDKNGKPSRAIAKVWRKDRRFPSIGEALWNEYAKPNTNGRPGVWDSMPSIMLAKCAKSLALREAFPQELNGLYTAEEMPSEYAVPVVSPATVSLVVDNKPAPEPEPTTPGDHRITGNGRKKLESIGKRVRDIDRAKLIKVVDKDSKIAEALSEADLNAIIAYLGETDTAPEVQVPIEEDDIPNFDQREAA